MPLDLTPQTRTQFILQDSLATVILTNNKNLSSNSFIDFEVQLINIDDFDLNFGLRYRPGDLSGRTCISYLYVGSTGKPKGVIETPKPAPQRHEEHQCSRMSAPTIESACSFDKGWRCREMR
jgi:hypothetical protein